MGGGGGGVWSVLAGVVGGCRSWSSRVKPSQANIHVRWRCLDDRSFLLSVVFFFVCLAPSLFLRAGRKYLRFSPVSPKAVPSLPSAILRKSTRVVSVSLVYACSQAQVRPSSSPLSAVRLSLLSLATLPPYIQIEKGGGGTGWLSGGRPQNHARWQRTR